MAIKMERYQKVFNMLDILFKPEKKIPYEITNPHGKKLPGQIGRVSAQFFWFNIFQRFQRFNVI